jgi:hypothetical protein
MRKRQKIAYSRLLLAGPARAVGHSLPQQDDPHPPLTLATSPLEGEVMVQKDKPRASHFFLALRSLLPLGRRLG